ncbi:hypothetical protein HCN44_000749 [Aphidius gifuensis]|uniref:G domain-containing protein n=1 Tax=Aphidius gifuensis TaxID=684658 RepID=A0A835CNL3_APHGI|nr:hypothetical protein HCN44_000749 [Aphidius gifuensis]
MNLTDNSIHMSSQNLDTNINVINRNKRDTTCIPRKKPTTKQITNSTKKNHTVSAIMDSLNQGTANIKYSDDPNIILLLGLSGAGKSTLAQYLFGNNSNLRSVAKRNFKCQATGDFYIEDTDKKIGNNPVLSHTELPDLVIDPETNTTIYDCPGFSDTRDPEHDISGAYFIKAVSDKAKALKFIFVVNYNSITIGANRKDFMILARHATNLLHDISKYNKSIALVATKIKDDKSDDQRIIAITDFLQEVRQTLNETNEEPNVQLFIDILLTTSGPENQNYTKIGFMPKFDTAGRLSDLPAVQAHKKSLLTLIHNNIKFTEINTTDLKPTISSDSVYYIDGLVNEVTQQMWFHIKNVVQKVQKNFSSLTEPNSVFTKTYSLIDFGRSKLLEIRNLANGPNITCKCIYQIQKTVRHLSFTNTNIQSVNHIIEYTSKLVDQLNFLENVRNHSVNHHSLKCTDGINRVVSYLEESSKWYKSLITLNKSSLNCDILKDYSTYDISNIISDKDSDKRLEETNVTFFLKKVYSQSTYDAEYQYLKDVKLSPKKIESFKKIFQFIIGYQFTHKNCSSVDNPLDDLSDYYTTEGFINELLAIEKLFNNLHEKIPFKEIYESFLNRIFKYSNKIINMPEHSENRKAVDYLYAIAASKYYRLIHNFDKNSIELNIIHYLSTVEKHIEEYDKVLKEVKINDYAQQYSKKIDATVKEANNFIENDLQTAIDESIEKLDENIAMLINELATKREGVNNEMQSLEKTRSMLESQLVLKTVFSSLQFVGAGLAIIGPVGAAVGAAVSTSGAVATSLLPEPNGTVPVSLPASVGKNIPKISEHLKNKGKILEKKLNLAENEVDDYIKKQKDNNLQDLKNIMQECKLQVLNVNPDNNRIVDTNDLKKLEKLNVNVTDLVIKKRTALDNKLSAVREQYNEALLNHNDCSAESVDTLCDLWKRKDKLKIDDAKMTSTDKLIELQGAINDIKDDLKSPKSKASELEEKKKSVLEKYEMEKKTGQNNYPESLQKLAELRESLIEKSENYTNILKEDKKKKEMQYESRIRLCNSVQNTISMGEAAFEAYSKYQNEQSKIKAVVTQIDQANVKIQKINEYQQSIYETLIPLIQKLASVSTENNFDDQSHAALDIKKWKIKDVITDIQNHVLDMTEGFEVQNQFKRTIDKVNYGMQTMIQMYDRIQDDIDRKNLANYIATISGNNKITNDPNLNTAINKLELVLKSNMISQEYDRAMDAFKQYVFPFAELYLGEFSVMYENNNLTNFIEKSRVKITSLQEKLKKETTSLHSKSQSNTRIDLITLSEKISTIEPYYTWEHDLYGDEISKLLQGQEITLRASTEQVNDRHAVMFNDIGVYFKMTNLSMQAEFDKIISNLYINMTHLGDSYYKCGNKMFIMSQPPQTFEHNVMPNSDKKFESGNTVYKILTDNRAILSPFTMWRLNLFKIGSFNFNQLVKYTNESIDLRLVGTGQYVYPEPAECNSNLEKYYKLGFTI